MVTTVLNSGSVFLFSVCRVCSVSDPVSDAYEGERSLDAFEGERSLNFK